MVCVGNHSTWLLDADMALACGAQCSAVAVCLSGFLRSFNEVLGNFETALREPNQADVFAHVYYNPQRRDNRLALQWLRNSPFVRGLVSEVFDETLEEDIVRDFPNYTHMREHDTFSVKVQRKETSAMLSMFRKIKLANELRKDFEQRRGKPYTLIVRARPDLAYGTAVDLITRMGSTLLQPGVLFTPGPPH
eukprot:3286090-Prymnesium_polylepis.1